MHLLPLLLLNLARLSKRERGWMLLRARRAVLQRNRHVNLRCHGAMSDAYAGAGSSVIMFPDARVMIHAAGYCCMYWYV